MALACDIHVKLRNGYLWFLLWWISMFNVISYSTTSAPKWNVSKKMTWSKTEQMSFVAGARYWLFQFFLNMTCVENSKYGHENTLYCVFTCLKCRLKSDRNKTTIHLKQMREPMTLNQWHEPASILVQYSKHLNTEKQEQLTVNNCTNTFMAFMIQISFTCFVGHACVCMMSFWTDI